MLNTLQDPKKIEEVGKFNKQVVQAHHAYFDYWLENTFLHWDFWLSLLFAITPWILWIIIRKKESSSRLLHVGFFSIIISSWLDFLGTTYGLWRYTGKILPTIPSYIPWDFAIIPVFIMLLLQYKPHVSPIWKSIFFGSISAFIGEPLFLWLGFYVIEKWSILYSFPIYILIYLICNKLSKVKNFKEIS